LYNSKSPTESVISKVAKISVDVEKLGYYRPETRIPAVAGMADSWRQINLLGCQGHRIKLGVRRQAWIHQSPMRRTNDRETLSATDWKQVVERASVIFGLDYILLSCHCPHRSGEFDSN